MRKTCFIGAGNMAEALVRGLLASGRFGKKDMAVCDVNPGRLSLFSSEYGIAGDGDARSVVAASDVVVFCVKPGVVPAVCRRIRPAAGKKKLYVSIAAGVRMSSVLRLLGEGTKLARVMPNAPALSLSGASCVCFGEGLSAGEEDFVLGMFGCLGKAFRVESEELMDAVTGLGGSGPAFVATFVEALCDGGVKAGLGRELSLALALQTVLGTSRMILESGAHPAEIRDMVASPGGTTMSGMHSLERGGFRAAVMSAVESAALRSAELSAGED